MTAPDDPDMTAAELALGVLEGDERAVALRRVLADPAFAQDVERWRARLDPLHAEWPEVEPGPAVWKRVAAITAGRADDARRWRWAAALSGVAATALLAFVLTRPAPVPVRVVPAPAVRAAPALVAVLKPEGGAPFGAVFDPATREVRLSGAVAVPSGREAELWTIGKDGVPHAAGLLTPAARGRLRLTRELAVAAGTTFAISIESAGGSPGAAPTGPVVATGTLVAI